MLKITNRGEFRLQVEAFVDRARVIAGQRLTQIVREAQIHAADISPVYSGDYASNWNVSYGSPDTTFVNTKTSGSREYKEYLGAGSASFDAPRDSRWGMGNFKMTGFALGQTVFLTNAANHDEPYAWKIEDDKINFRDVNRGKHSIGRTTADWITRRLGV